MPRAGFACIGTFFEEKSGILPPGKGKLTAVPDSDLSCWYVDGRAPTRAVIKYAPAFHVNRIDHCHFPRSDYDAKHPWIVPCVMRKKETAGNRSRQSGIRTSSGGCFMRKAICFGLSFAFLLSIGATRGSSADLSELIERAGKGEAGAQNGLAEMYRKGEGVPKNTADAAQWYRRAAEQGAGDAQSALGKMYRDGEGGPKNDAEAAKWVRKAAAQEVVEDETNL